MTYSIADLPSSFENLVTCVLIEVQEAFFKNKYSNLYKLFFALVALTRIFISALVKSTKMLSGLKADIYPLISECMTCSKILPTKIMACPNCGRQDPTGYEAKREYDFQIILLKSVKRMCAYLAIMVSVAVPTFLLIFSK